MKPNTVAENGQIAMQMTNRVSSAPLFGRFSAARFVMTHRG
jgi:hypothetical protein